MAGVVLVRLALLDTVAKSSTASWQMAKACSAPRRGQLLMRTLMQLHQGGRGPGELGLGARLQLQLVSPWRLLNPSRQVHSTWAKGLRDREARPSLQGSRCNALPGVHLRPGCPCDYRPPRPGKWGVGAQAAVLVISLHALHGWGCHPTLPESVSACRNTQAAPGITSQQDCSCWLCSWARRSRPEPLSLPFPAHAASRSQPQVAKR